MNDAKDKQRDERNQRLIAWTWLAHGVIMVLLGTMVWFGAQMAAWAQATIDPAYATDEQLAQLQVSVDLFTTMSVAQWPAWGLSLPVLIIAAGYRRRRAWSLRPLLLLGWLHLLLVLPASVWLSWEVTEIGAGMFLSDDPDSALVLIVKILSHLFHLATFVAMYACLIWMHRKAGAPGLRELLVSTD